MVLGALLLGESNFSFSLELKISPSKCSQVTVHLRRLQHVAIVGSVGMLGARWACIYAEG